MPKKICCPKCKSENLQFVETKVKKPTAIIFAIILFAVLSLICATILPSAIQEVTTNDLELVTEKTWQKALEVIVLIAFWLSLNIAAIACFVVYNQRNKEAKIKAVCSYCGHSELLEKLTAPKKKYDYDEDEEE